MRAHRRANIVSPHRDDAALSLTCTLRELINDQIDVRILSCFTVSGWAPTVTYEKGLEAISILREEEDVKYAKFMGCDGLESLGCIDAPLRSDWFVKEGVLQPPDPATKQPLIEMLQQKLSAYKQPNCAWFVPMAHSHRDHFLARSAALNAAGGEPICIYEDVPYSLKAQPVDASRTISILQNLLGSKLSPRTLHKSFDSALWLTGMRHYASQFTDAELTSVCEALAAQGGERIWTTKAFDSWIEDRGYF